MSTLQAIFSEAGIPQYASDGDGLPGETRREKVPLSMGLLREIRAWLVSLQAPRGGGGRAGGSSRTEAIAEGRG